MVIDSTNLIFQKLYDSAGRLVYEGYTYEGKACGKGKSYWENGNLYQEGEFGIKGLVNGTEYYPNGRPRFIGRFQVWTAYGPNPPEKGQFFDPEGNLVYEGKFSVSGLGGVGYPKVLIPENYGPIPQSDREPKFPIITWEYGSLTIV